MEKYNLTVLAEAKQEYTRQLVNILYAEIYIGIKSIYDAAKIICDKKDDKNILKKFQKLLSDIPKWNTDRINTEYKRILKASDCEWFEDLITAVFVSHTKVLTSIKIKNKNKKALELNVPNGPYFLHKCYIESARNFWKKPYLFYHNFTNIELQRNMADAEELIKESIIESIRKQLPVKHILQEYLGNDYQDDDENEDVSSHVSVNTKENLRKLVKAEIEQTLCNKKDEDTHSTVHIFGSSSSPKTNTLDDLVNDKKSESVHNANDNLYDDNDMEKTNGGYEIKSIVSDRSTVENIKLDNFMQNNNSAKPDLDEESIKLIDEMQKIIQDNNIDLENNETVAVEDKNENITLDITDTIKKIEITPSVKEEPKPMSLPEPVLLPETKDEEPETVNLDDNFSFFDDAPPF
jgi:hypothetical protein